jgi:hypothetical protein
MYGEDLMNYLDPVVYINILPGTIMDQSFRLVLLHHLTSGQLNVHLNFRLAPVLLAEIQLAKHILRRLW